MKTRNGKIARLPRELREQLNRRLEDGEPGNRLVEWLNALPDTQRVLATDFGGREINEQNLSEWKQGGFRDWQKQQKRRELVRQLTEDAAELNADAGGAAISDRLSAVLVVELAQAAREVLDATTDAEARWQRLQELAAKFVQLRREEANAGRTRIALERWEREKTVDGALKRATGSLMPRHALLLQELYLSDFGQRGGHLSQPEAGLGEIMFPNDAPARSKGHPDQGKSN